MGRIGRFLSLSTRDKRLLLSAAFLLSVARLGLYALSFERLRGLLAGFGRAQGATRDEHHYDVSNRIVWAVETTSRALPRIGTCLTQALAVHVLLARNGIASELRIGVTRTSDGRFIAHAWLEKDAHVLIGEAGHKNYSPMPALNLLEP
jgi:hypothetical protein